MADIAQIGFQADTSQLKTAQSALQALGPAANTAQTGANNVATAFNKVGAAAGQAASSTKSAATAVSQAASGIGASVTPINAAAAAHRSLAAAQGLNRMQSMELMHVGKSLFDSIAAGASPIRALTMESGRLVQVITEGKGGFSGFLAAIGLMRATTLESAAANGDLAASDQLAARAAQGLVEATVAKNEVEIAAADTELGLAEAAVRLAATSTEAAAAQGRLAAAIAGVAAASAEAVIGDDALAAANAKVAESAEAAAAAEGTALAPLAFILGGIVLAVGFVAGAFGLAARKIRSDTGDVTDSMNLTKKQTDDLKDHIDGLKGKKIDVEVTGMDTFKAFFVTLWEEIQDASGHMSLLKTAWNDTMDFLTKYGEEAIKFIVGVFMGGFDVIKATFKQLPDTLGDIFYQAANKSIAGINWLINKVIEGVNTLGGHLDNVKIDPLANPFAGASDKSTADATKAFVKGYSDAGKAVDDFGKKWEANAVKIAQHRILKAVGPDHSKGPAEKKDPWQELLTGAQNDINTQNAKAAEAALNLTAEGAATLEEKTKLLNEAQSKGIVLDDQKRAKIDALAAAYGKAKVAADNAVGLKDVLKSGDKDIADLQAQTDQIGLYGRALAYATEMAKLLGEAKAKNMTPDAIAAAMPQFQTKANTYADASASDANAKFMEQQRQGYLNNTQALATQRAEIGMTADATTKYEEEQKLLNDAMQQHIDLSPNEIQQLKAYADAQADTENSIRKTKEALDFVSDGAKGFVTDLRTSLEQGKSLFSSFADAVTNLLNKVIDKLLDLALTSALGGGGSTPGDFLSSIGKLLGGNAGSLFGGGSFSASTDPLVSNVGAGAVTMTATGGAFNSNGIVDTPTSYAFGSGKKGVMGEKGPEAVVPLTRGSDGSLGVQLNGGSNSNGPQTVQHNVQVDNHYTITGAVSSADVNGMVRQSADQTKSDVKKSLMGWIAQYQRDGTL